MTDVTSTTTRRSGRRPRVLIIVQNLPVPFDRRVWLECQALDRRRVRRHRRSARGARTTPEHEVLDGVTIHTYRPYAPGRPGRRLRRGVRLLVPGHRAAGAQGASAGPVRRASRPATRRTSSGRWPAGCGCATARRFVFDHHDLCPELYESRFPDGARLPLRGPARARAGHLPHGRPGRCRRTRPTRRSRYAAAASARERRHRRPHRARPERAAAPGAPDPALRRGRRHLVAYLGVMGPQDGVDLALARRRRRRARARAAPTSPSRSWAAGDCYDDLVALRDRARARRTTWSSRAGCRTRRSPTSSRPRTSGCPRPEEPAQRRLHDEQDAWSTWPSGCRSSRSTSRRPGSRPATPRSTSSRTATSTRYARAIVELLDDAASGGPRWASAAGDAWCEQELALARTSATAYVGGLRRPAPAPRRRRGRSDRPTDPSVDGGR